MRSMRSVIPHLDEKKKVGSEIHTDRLEILHVESYLEQLR